MTLPSWGNREDIPASLAEIVDIAILREIHDNFTSATGLSVTLMNPDGSPLIMPANVPTFCRVIHAHAGMPERCYLPFVIARLDLEKGDSPFCFRCCSEVQCVVAPIIVESRLLGVVQGSHIWRDGQGVFLLGPRGPEEPTYAIPNDKLYGAARSLQLLARHVAELGLTALRERRQKEYNAAIAEEVRARAELEKALKDAELKSLRARVNPHFLFNTLNVIAELAVMGKTDDAAEVTYALASLLRASLRKGDKMVTLREEVGWLKDYIAIQQVRFKDSLRFIFEIEGDVWEALVPFMTLQPIVENSIVHGFSQIAEGGEIRIQAVLKGDHIHISVRDNGAGMKTPRLMEVLESLRLGRDESVSEGLGLSNLHRRLQYHFGSNFLMWIDSSVNEGTLVKLVLPIRRDLP